MDNRLHRWKQFSVYLCILASLICCKKPQVENNSTPTQQQSTSIYQALTDLGEQTGCGSVFTTDLKIKDGSAIGKIDISNNSEFLFLTYHLSSDWYLTSAECYAGQKSAIPLTPKGNPNHSQFPGKKTLNPCDLVQNLTYRIPLSQLQFDANSQCTSNSQFFIAMRAAAKPIKNNSNCATGAIMEAWAAPFLINPGDASEWATAFYYCKRECDETTAHGSQPSSWCALGQGYWFAKPNVIWCRDFVQFGNLVVKKDEGRSLWSSHDNVPKKAFFQASALQLSMVCNNNNNPIPQSIAADYNKLVTFLSALSLADIEKGTVPRNANIQSILTSAGNIGKWICQNNCNASVDPTFCQ